MERTPISSSSAARLLSRTKKTESGCLEYQGCVQSNGYARATVGGRAAGAHRHIYELVKGEIPAGMDVCHRCDNRRCINPDHLFLGTRLENMADAVKKGRQAHGDGLPFTKPSAFIVSEIGRLASQGMSYREVAAQFGITRQHAGYVARKQGIHRHGK